MTTIKALTQIAFEWGCRCFGLDHMNNRQIRALRFVEEAIELAQACGLPEDKIAECARVVYSRPVGMIYQEIGGTMVTLTVLCHALGIDPEEMFQVEIRRCLAKDPAHFAERNKQKLDLGLTG